MSFDFNAQALASILHEQTLRREVSWQMAPPTVGSIDTPPRALRYETTYKGFRFALYQQHGIHPQASMGRESWCVSHVLAVLDQEGNEVWQESDSRQCVSRLYRFVQRRLTCISDVFATIVDPVQAEIDQQLARHRETPIGLLANIRRFSRSVVARFQ